MGTPFDRLRSQRAAESVRAPSGRSRIRRIFRRRVRPLGREVIVSARRAVPGRRMQPSFLVIGAQKAGTTSLYGYLVQHPRILPALAKEIRYFDRYFQSRSPGWYAAHFPRRRRVPVGDGGPLTGEATPSYLYYPDVPARVRSRLPGVKIIALVRDPVARAYSHYQHSVDMGVENLPLDRAIERDIARLERHPEASSDAAAMFANRYSAYVERGLYEVFLSRWLKAIPKDRLLVLETQRLAKDLEGTLSGVAEFLDIEPWLPRSAARLNVRRYDPIPEAVAERLRAFYEPYDRRLVELLERPVSWAT